VVGLVVDGQDIFHAHQLGHDPLEHLPFGFKGVERLAAPSLKKEATALGDLQSFPQFEGVVIGDDDLCPRKIGQHVGGDKLTALVIAVRVVGLEHPEAITDGNAWSHDQKATGELLAGRTAHGIDGLPGDEHGHDRGLARAGGQFQRQSHEFRVCVVVGVGKMLKKTAAGLAGFGGNLDEPDGGFHRLDLTEEWPDTAKVMMPPVLKEAGGFRGDLPVSRVGQAPPFIYLLA